MQNTGKKNRKKNPMGLIVWVIIILYFGVQAMARSYGLSFEQTLHMLLWRYRPYIVPAAAALVIFVVVFILVKAVSRIKKEEPQHTHDRTDRISYDRNETEYEHYKKQLDGFLKAGIIEKDEYRLLLNRFSQGKV